MGEYERLETRLTRLEAQLARIEDLLTKTVEGVSTNGPAKKSRQAKRSKSTEGPGVPFAAAASRAELALRQVYGSEDMDDRVSELFMRLAEPETLESLTRIGVLLPRIEYALQFLAAGPELLEEGLEMVQHRLAEVQETPHGLRRRVDAVARAAEALSRPSAVNRWAEFQKMASDVQPAATAVAAASSALSGVEGASSLQGRLTEAMVRLAEPEILDALVRVATLTPDIEYAVNFLAAGPALLEEGLESVKAWAEQQPHDGPPMDQRAKALAAGLYRLSDPENLNAMVRVAELLPKFVRSLEQFSEVVDQIDLSALTELGRTIASADIRKALVRLVELAPDLERSLAVLPKQEVTLDVLAGLNQAVARAAVQSRRMGLFGLLGAMNDDDVQRALGFTVAIARQFGQDLSKMKLAPGGSR